MDQTIRTGRLWLLPLLFTVSAASLYAVPGRIVVNSDEWTTSDAGFMQAGAENATAFVRNVATFLNRRGGAGRFLIYSSDFALTQNSFLNALRTAGHTVTVDSRGTTPFTLTSLQAFDAVFLAGSPLQKNDAVLTSYVNAGGGVYIAGGTGIGGPSGEADRWNPFLAPFGITLPRTSPYNGVAGVKPVTGRHPLLTNVRQLYYANGSVLALSGRNANAGIIEVVNGQSMLAVFDPDTAFPAITALVNAASFKPGGVSPGEIVTLGGTLIGPPQITTFRITPAGLMDNSLAATRVLFDGVPAPLVYVRTDQTSAIVPYSVAGKRTTNVVVEFGNLQSAPFPVDVAATSPAIFTMNNSGTGPGAILNLDFSLNSADNPVEKGGYVQIFGTGEGQTNPAGADGSLAVSTLPKPRATVSATVGGLPAEVQYAGAAPGLVAGLLQVNVKILRFHPIVRLERRQWSSPSAE